MRGRLLPAAAALALGLNGCATVGPVALPAPSPPPVRAAEAVALPPPVAKVAPLPAPLSPQPELPPPPPAPPAPDLVKPPPTTMTPPVSSSPVTATPAAPAAPVVPPAPQPRILGQQVSSEDEKRIQADAQRRIDRTERLMKQIDERRLVGEQHQNLLTVQSFLVKAREALTEKDVQRALTLADKAYLLAEELVKVVR